MAPVSPDCHCLVTHGPQGYGGTGTAPPGGNSGAWQGSHGHVPPRGLCPQPLHLSFATDPAPAPVTPAAPNRPCLSFPAAQPRGITELIPVGHTRHKKHKAGGAHAAGLWVWGTPGPAVPSPKGHHCSPIPAGPASGAQHGAQPWGVKGGEQPWAPPASNKLPGVFLKPWQSAWPALW